MIARRTGLLSLALVVLALSPAVASADSALAGAIAALRQDRVYVDPNADVRLGTPETKALQSQIANDDPGRIFVALLPGSTTAAAGGTVARVGRALEHGVGKPGIYAIIVGKRFEAGSDVLRRGEAAAIATQSFDAHHDQGPYTVLASFVSAAAQSDRQTSGSTPLNPSPGSPTTPPAAARPKASSGTSAGLIDWLVIIAIAFVLVLLFLTRTFSRRKLRAGRIEEVRRVAREDQLALGDDIRELDLDISMPNADPGAKQDYGKALDCYEQAGRALDKSKTLGDLAAAPAKLEEGRWLMESARARLAGKPPPERRAPCFFDPRHGPSVQDVDWAPAGGSRRKIPVCAADATRIKDGEEPMARTIVLNGRRIPYWRAPRYYAPYAGGYYGDYGGSTLLTGFVIGGVLDQHDRAGSWDSAGSSAGGDFGGGGSFGGGGDSGGGGGGDSGGGGGGDSGGGGNF